MTSKGQKKFILVLVVWFIGLISANSSCTIFVSWAWVVDFIPAVESYKLASAPENACAAQGMWTYAWLVAPVYLCWLVYIAYVEPTYDRTVRQRRYGVVFLLSIFAVLWMASFYGIYDPYPGTDKGRWASMYRESGIGVTIVTAVAWYGMYTAFLMSVMFITEILGIKRNR